MAAMGSVWWSRTASSKPRAQYVTNGAKGERSWEDHKANGAARSVAVSLAMQLFRSVEGAAQ